MLRHIPLIVIAAVSYMTSSAFAAEPIARISALVSGQILLDGKATSIPDLDKALANLKTRNGIVFYYRERANEEPSAQAMMAIQLVVKHKLPISMSTKADFSDYLDANGVSRPRKP